MAPSTTPNPAPSALPADFLAAVTAFLAKADPDHASGTPESIAKSLAAQAEQWAGIGSEGAAADSQADGVMGKFLPDSASRILDAVTPLIHEAARKTEGGSAEAPHQTGNTAAEILLRLLVRVVEDFQKPPRIANPWTGTEWQLAALSGHPGKP